MEVPSEENSCCRPLLLEDNQREQDEDMANTSCGNSSYTVHLQHLLHGFFVEYKKLWSIAAPALCSRLATTGMNVVTLAFAGHLGDLQLAAASMAISVIVSFNFGFFLGMASALQTLCGQSFGAKKFRMLGIYLQRSWIVLSVIAILLLPIYIFATPILKAVGQTEEIADLAGEMSLWLIPNHLSYAFAWPMQRFLQTQLKNMEVAVVSVTSLVIHVILSWLFVVHLDWGLVGAALSLDAAMWLMGLGLYLYIVCGGCQLTWTGFSLEAFSGLWEYGKLSLSSGVMLCLEFWYYRVLIIVAGNLSDAEVAVDALTVCLNITQWEFMIHVAFLSATSVRVANELGAGNGEGARIASIISVLQSVIIGLFVCCLVVIFRNQICLLFTSSSVVIEAVSKLAILLAFTILLNSIQPVLSGVAIGAGWQARVAYVNIGCYYLVGIPFGLILGFLVQFGTMGIWSGMLGGTALQTLVLVVMTLRCDWEMEAEKARLRLQKYGSTPKAEKNPVSPQTDINGSGNNETTSTT